MSEKNKDNKSNWAIGLSIVAIVLCLLVLALWIFEAIPHSVIVPESFIGACVALLGVIVTIAVGAQIVNVMEIKSSQKVYENELKTALETIKHQQHQIAAEQIRNAHLHHCTMAMIAEFQGHYPQAIYYFFGALLNGLQMQEPLGNENFALEHIANCMKNCADKADIPEQWKQNLKSNDKVICTLSNYHWIKERYEPLRDEFFKKIGLMQL